MQGQSWAIKDLGFALMAAIAGSRHNPDVKALYERLMGKLRST